MKLNYLIPDINVVKFETEDVITVSGTAGGGLNHGGNVNADGGGDSIDAGDLFN